MNIVKLNKFRKYKSLLYKFVYRKSPLFLKIVTRYLFFLLFEKRMNAFGNSDFPLMDNGDSYLYNLLLPENNKIGFCTQFYHEQNVNNIIVNPKELLNYKYEILHGQKYSKDSECKIQIDSNSLIPFSIVNKNQSNEQSDKYNVEISTNDKEYLFQNLSQNRFHYFPIKEKSNIKLNCNYDFIVGTPLKLQQEKKHKKKLVLSIFIDGLASEIFKLESVKKLMPNTYEFFQSGSIMLNATTNADWTDPSVPSIFSGLHSINHRVFDEESPNIGCDYKLISEFFQEDDYLTAQFCSNYGKSPSGGYTKGFDRTIYKRSMTVELIVNSFLEHIRTFEKRDNFIWLSIIDLHHFLDLVPAISTQSLVDLEYHDYKDVKTKVVVGAYNMSRTKRFMAELKRIDFYLKTIFDYISNNYKDDEFIVSICSDHGQPYITHEKPLFSRQRTAVPFMIRSSEVGHGILNHRIDNIDILPTILSLSKIRYNPHQFDGVVPKIFGGNIDRKYSYVESIFDGKPYTVAIIDDEHRFYFETKDKVSRSNFFAFDEYNIKLVNSKTDIDETKRYQDKVDEYVEIVMDHILNSRYYKDFIQ
jgi:hypothetical protein